MENPRDKLLDLNQLDILSAENPPMFLDSFEVYYRQYQDSGALAHIMYFKAKSLVAINKFDEAIQISIDLMGKAVIVKDYYLLVKCNILLSRCYFYSEVKYRTKPCLELAVEYAQASMNAELLAEVFSNFGSYYLDTNDLGAAKEYMLKAIRLTKRLPASYTIITILHKVAFLYNSQQNYDTVILYLSTALKMCEEVDITITRLRIISNLAKAYTEIKKYTLADELINRGIELCKRSNNISTMLLFTFDLATSKTCQNKPDEAILTFDQCIALVNDLQINEPRFFMDIYNNYAICYGQNNNYGKALEYLNKSYDIAEQLNSIEDCMHINSNKSQAMVNLGMYEEAEALLKKVIGHHKKEQNFSILILAQISLALLHEKRKDYRSSLKAHKELEKTYEKYITHIMNEKTVEAQQQILELSALLKQKDNTDAYPCKCYLDRDNLEFIGCSDAHQKVIDSALLAAQNPNTNVFIIGDSGTGKEIIAQMIHQKSLRRGYPFVAVNASAISANLVESELFGHVKGSFTGAISDTNGFFVQANKGTLFLDEITEMPLELQAKLLRAIESRKVTPVGGTKEVSFDCRIISSTNRNIFELIERSEFRLDLFHRLNPLEIYIPPLRNRKEDIEILVHHFIDLYTNETKRKKPQIDASFLDYLQNYDFPGNVRELKNIIERLFILANTSHWDSSVCSLINNYHYDYDRPKPLSVEKQGHETEAIIKALIQAGGKQKTAAKLLNMSESTLTRRIEKYRLQDYTNKGK
ncbi:MAG: sigma 54-interacting transcriptional regulator [Candidatus Cloacimonetes bacterium]|nr:sigma 54-interacting transcriptional regulator [Candidatus Cloacimonadota bacterium]